MSITWGDVEFEGPYPITEWEPPRVAAVYAIMMKAEPEDKPTTYRVLYFGESENLDDRGFYKSHHKYSCWKAEAGSDSNIYIGIHRMPNSSRKERREVEGKLIAEYHPVCNEE